MTTNDPPTLTAAAGAHPAHPSAGHPVPDAAILHATRMPHFAVPDDAPPRPAPKLPSVALMPPGPYQPRPNPGLRGTLLVVDDEEDILATVASFLGFRLPNLVVTTARDGPAGLAALAAHAPAAPDLVLSDFRMPGMDGLEFLAQARRLAPHAGQVLMTAYPDLQLAVKALNENRVLFFLTKPIEPERLATVVEQAFVLALERRTERSALGLAMHLHGKLRDVAGRSETGRSEIAGGDAPGAHG